MRGIVVEKYCKIRENESKNFADILKTNKLYDKETKYLLCPNCHIYCVGYLSSKLIEEYYNRWWCKNCISSINYHDYDVDIDDKDKYQIYKLWGLDALSTLTNESIRTLKRFVASYFKSSCVSKKDKCPYFNFFDE
jgi:hypothetical protein